MSRSIFVPLDGSGFGEHALPLALSLARRIGASLHLSLVHEPVFLVEPTAGGAMYSYPLDTHFRDQETKYLQEVSQRVCQCTTQPSKAELLDGSVVDALLLRMKAVDPEWVVLATHGRGPFSRFWIGSVADSLVRNTTVPLLLVRPGEGPADIKRDVAIQHVLICLDGSPLAETVLEPAIALGTAFGADFTLLQVVRPPLFTGHDPARPDLEVFGQPATEQLQKDAEQYVRQLAERLRKRNLKVDHKVVVNVQPASAILDQSQKQPDTLLALSTHGRGGLVRAFLGSVADKVMRGATTPMLIYRPTK